MQPPHTPDSYNQPAYSPPPGYGYAPVPPPGPAPREPRGIVSLDVISEAWAYFTANIGPWLLAMVAYFGISYAFSAVRGILDMAGNNTGSSVWTILGLLLQLVSWAVTQFLLAGIAKMAVQNVRNRIANINEMWTVTDIWVKAMLSTILQTLIYLVVAIPGIVVLGISIFGPLSRAGLLNPAVWTKPGPPPISPALLGGLLGGSLVGVLLMVLLIIPVSSMLFLTTTLLVDRKLGPWEAIAVSFGTLKKHFWGSVLLCLVLGLLNVVGFMLCCIGLFATFPVTMIAVALVYRDLFGVGESSIPMAPISAPPPIASPNF